MTDQMTSEIENQIEDAEYAFVVIKQRDGRFGIANVNNEKIEKSPTMEDVQHALYVLTEDIKNQKMVMAVATAMQAVTGNQQAQTVAPEKRFVKRTTEAANVS
jgi:hypothetical protein